MIGESSVGGTGAAVTALGGVVVSLATIYFQAQKTATNVGQLDEHANETTAQIEALEAEVSKLRDALGATTAELARLNDIVETLRADRDRLRVMIDRYGGWRLRRALTQG